MKEFDDELMRDMLMKSSVRLDNQEFTAATMKAISRESRRRRIVNSFMMNFLVFIAVDALIWLGISLTGSGVAGLVDGFVSGLNRLVFQAGQIKATVVGSDLVTYVVLIVGALAALLSVLELRIGSWER